MTSYLRYKQELRTVQDADDIESWITVRGNHIPIKKGQSKEEAVKSFIEGKKKNLVENHNSLVEAMNLEKKGYFKKDPRKRDSITQSAIEMGKEEKNLEELMEFGVKEANNAKPESKYSPEFETVRKNALANGNVYGGKYTQKSKAEAYKEYKNDTSSKENMKKANEFVNGTLIDKRNLPAGTKWSPTDIYGNGTGNKKEEKSKYNIQHGAKISDIESMINAHADKKAYKSWKEEEEYVAEKLKEEGIYAYGSQIKEAMKNVYGDDYTKERNEEPNNAKSESKPKSSGKTTFYKNVSGKELWSPAWKGSGRKSGYTAIENQLLTEKEMEKHGFNKESSAFKKVELGKKDHHYMFGARFETKKGDK